MFSERFCTKISIKKKEVKCEVIDIHRYKRFVGICYLNNQNIKNFEVPTYNLNDEKLLVEDIDYYYSNTIARASKTMSECRYARANLKKTVTEG